MVVPVRAKVRSRMASVRAQSPAMDRSIKEEIRGERMRGRRAGPSPLMLNSKANAASFCADWQSNRYKITIFTEVVFF